MDSAKTAGRRCLMIGSSILLALAIIIGAPISESQAADLKKINIGLPTKAFWPSSVVYAAYDQKFYEKEGLNAEITVYRGGAECAEALAAGAADIIAYLPPGVAAARQKGVKMIVVATGMVTPAGWYVMAKEGSPIKGVKDLEGKKIGITSKGSTSDFLCLWAFHNFKVKANQIPLGGGGLVPNLLSGNVDAIVIYAPLGYSLLVSKEAKILVDFGKEMPPSLPDAWVSTERLVSEKPDVVQKGLNAIFGGVNYLQKNRNYAINFMKKYLETTTEIATMEYEKTIMSLPPDGALNLNLIKGSLEWAKIAGFTNLPQPQELFSDKFTPIKNPTKP